MISNDINQAEEGIDVDFVNVTRIFIIGISVVMMGYCLIQMHKENQTPRMIPRKKILLLTMLYCGLIALCSLGRWTVFFSWY